MEVSYGISSKKPLNPNLNCNLHNCCCRYLNFIWVSQRLRLIYFETPKCGCTSIKTALDVFIMSPLHFATAYLIQNQNCCEQRSANGILTTMDCSNSNHITQDALHSASLSAASNLSKGECWSDPVGKYEFMHFFGSPEQAIALFPGYRRFIVFRDPFDRLLSAWNMFYNSNSFRLRERLLQCKDAVEEKKSFRHFIHNIWTYPNHHFDRIVNFVPSEVLAKGVDVVPFEYLYSYWESIKNEYHFPSLSHLNAARNYLETDVDKSYVIEDKKFIFYYSEDYELMKLAS